MGAATWKWQVWAKELLPSVLEGGAPDVSLQQVLLSKTLDQFKPQASLAESASCGHGWDARKSWHLTLIPVRRRAWRSLRVPSRGGAVCHASGDMRGRMAVQAFGCY